MSLAPALAMRMSSAAAESVCGHGTVTAPILIPASMTSIQLSLLATSTNTRSPERTPCSLSCVAHLVEPSTSWWKVRGSITPSAPRSISACRFGSAASASITSFVKLK